MVGVYCFVTKACVRRPGAAASVERRRASRSDTLAASHAFERMHIFWCFSSIPARGQTQAPQANPRNSCRRAGHSQHPAPATCDTKYDNAAAVSRNEYISKLQFNSMSTARSEATARSICWCTQCVQKQLSIAYTGTQCSKNEKHIKHVTAYLLIDFE